MICEIKFRNLMRLRKFFNNENFPIYSNSLLKHAATVVNITLCMVCL